MRRENYIRVYFRECLFMLTLPFSSKCPLKMKVYLMQKYVAIFVIAAFVQITLLYSKVCAYVKHIF